MAIGGQSNTDGETIVTLGFVSDVDPGQRPEFEGTPNDRRFRFIEPTPGCDATHKRCPRQVWCILVITMSPKHSDVSGLAALLKSIVERWPKTGAEDLKLVQRALRETLAAGFDSLDLQNRVTTLADLKAVDTRFDDTAVVDL